MSLLKRQAGPSKDRFFRLRLELHASSSPVFLLHPEQRSERRPFLVFSVTETSADLIVF